MGNRLPLKTWKISLILHFLYNQQAEPWTTHYNQSWTEITLQMERYIRTQSSPPASPVTPQLQARPPAQSPLTSQFQPQKPHAPPLHQVGGELKKGSSTSSLERDRVITQAKVSRSITLPLMWYSPPRWWRSSPRAPTVLSTISGAASPLVTTPGEARPRACTVCRCRRTTSSWAGPPTSQVTRGSPDTANSQRDLDSCTGTPNNSGRNSPVCWQTPSLAKHNRSNGDHQPETKVRGFGAFNSIYDVGFKFPQIRSIFAKYQENKSKDSSHNNGKVSGFKKILKILTFGLSGNSQG